MKSLECLHLGRTYVRVSVSFKKLARQVALIDERAPHGPVQSTTEPCPAIVLAPACSRGA